MRGVNSERTQFGSTPLMQPQRSLLTLDEVAKLLCVSRAWVRDHATRRNPRIPVVRFGGKRAVLRFRPEHIERFIAEHVIAAERSV
jgi:hypothetical protein